MKSFLKAINLLLFGVLVFLGQAERTLADESGVFNAPSQPGIISEGLHTQGSPAITDAHREVFGNHVMHLSQQKISKLMPYVEVVGQVGRAMLKDRIGTLGEPQAYVGRNSTVHASNPENDVRLIEARRFWLACNVDQWDQLRTLWDIQNAYVVAISRSFGRFFDSSIIAGGLGEVTVGTQLGGNTVALPNTQKLVAVEDIGTQGSPNIVPAGMNLDVLQRTRLKMKETFAIEEDEMAVFILSAAEVHNLLKETQTTSRDFTSVYTLLSGQITAFYGFVFVETQLVPFNSVQFRYDSDGNILSAGGTQLPAGDVGKFRRCMAFTAGSAICMGMNQNIISAIETLIEKHMNTLIYFAVEFGVMRKEEVKVVEVLCKVA